MNKILKRISIVLVAALSVVCLAVFAAACETEKDETVYTLVIVDNNGNAIKGADISADGKKAQFQLCDVNTGVCIATTPEIDANGKAVISSGFEEGATYEVHILYFNDAKYNSDKGEVEKMSALSEYKRLTYTKVSAPCTITVTLTLK